ncbi:hypothetical protein HNP82_003540 [Catenibacillus scindens]|uniref:Uncharacterized protein n=1 Tax=Catenibacillus scindens TaxID=673271 RepID=A0A7W8HDI4_9FIRM|nr:hypothetical protein [Catenibacillus scindens]MBB5266383.1 hypothetical protein [Catenibacillus scindens]
MIPLKNMSDYESDYEMLQIIAHDQERAILVPRQGVMMFYFIDDPEGIYLEGNFAYKGDAYPLCILPIDEEEQIIDRYQGRAVDARKQY